MNRIEILAKRFEEHISLPWQQHLAPSERIIFVVYPKEDERRLRSKTELFQQSVLRTGHGWREINLETAFPDWMTSQEYAEDYFTFPEDLDQKLETDFSDFVWRQVSGELNEISENDLLAVFGVGTLFGLTHVSTVLKKLETGIRGRLVVFFPGTHEKNTYRLLDARDGWGYMAFPITLTEEAYQ